MLAITHLGSCEVTIEDLCGIGSHALERSTLLHSQVVGEDTESSSHLFDVRVVQPAELLRLDCETDEVDSQVDAFRDFVDQTHGLTLKLGRLECRSILQICLLVMHIGKHLFFELAEVRCFDLQAKQVQILEHLSVQEKDSFSDQVLALGFLAVANILLDVPRVVPRLHDVAIGG